MENKTVGMIILGITLLMGFIIFSFNRALTQMVKATCSHGTSCVMWQTLRFQTNVGIGIMVFVALIGFYLIFFKEKKTHKKIKADQIKKPEVKKENYQEILKELNEEEKKVFEKILDEQGSVFQSKLVEDTGFTKVKVTRLLDRLEGQGLIERKRRGMTNVVILKQQGN
tara:strand:+ start:2283 stop:2789 length:507 start_codon:yes stop_codon:yes gene_type:complete